jgi:REP element-mobilizing transposase RayT
MDRLLDRAATGPQYLRMPNVAQLVEAAIQCCEGYSLHAWVIMPNHVHLLLTPHSDVSELMRKLKGVTARGANVELHRTGPFWQHESYDRVVRDTKEFSSIENYILNNPVHAGLASSPELHRWSSAWVGGPSAPGAG